MERELPKDTCPSIICIITILGLCTGGNVELRSKALGYVPFVRAEKAKLSGKSYEHINVEWYREETLSSFVTDFQVTLYGMNHTGPILDLLAEVCWKNGVNIQLAAIVDEIQQQADEKNKICRCKHIVSHISVKQACN